MVLLQIESLPDPSNRFELGEELATGSWAQVCFPSKKKYFLFLDLSKRN